MKRVVILGGGSGGAVADRTEPMKLREAIEILRSPDVAAALEMLVSVLRSQRG